MSQGSLLLPTTGTVSGLTLVNDLNTALDALVTNNSGSSAPNNSQSGAPEEGQLWVNTATTGAHKLEIFDGTSWLTVAVYDQTAHVWKPGIGGGSDTLASASTTDLGTVGGSFVTITGTTTITSLGSSAPLGQTKILKFSGILTLTQNATSLILPTGANIITAAGDIAIATQSAAGDWSLLYFRASGQPLAASTGTIFPGNITGLLPSGIVGSSTTAALTVSTGFAADSTAAAIINLASPSSWAVSNGDAANGYQGGTTLPNSTTIHFFVAQGASGVCTFASTSLTPTLPAGFTTVYRRIFSLMTNSSGALIPITADEGPGGSITAYLNTITLDLNGVTLSTANRTLQTMNVPQGIKVQWQGVFLPQNAGNFVVWMTSPDEPDTAPSNSNTTPIWDITSDTAFSTIASRRSPPHTNTSGQIGFRGTVANTIFAYTTGWIDARRS